MVCSQFATLPRLSLECFSAIRPRLLTRTCSGQHTAVCCHWRLLCYSWIVKLRLRSSVKSSLERMIVKYHRQLCMHQPLGELPYPAGAEASDIAE